MYNNTEFINISNDNYDTISPLSLKEDMLGNFNEKIMMGV